MRLNIFHFDQAAIDGLLAGCAVPITLEELFNPLRARNYFSLYRLNHSFEITTSLKQKK